MGKEEALKIMKSWPVGQISGYACRCGEKNHHISPRENEIIDFNVDGDIIDAFMLCTKCGKVTIVAAGGLTNPPATEKKERSSLWGG
jgi:hypothetical protein